MKVHLSIGVGGWSFSVEREFKHVPAIGEDVSADGDGATYTVTHKTVTPTLVYLTCNHRFVSEEEAHEAEKEWRS